MPRREAQNPLINEFRHSLRDFIRLSPRCQPLSDLKWPNPLVHRKAHRCHEATTKNFRKCCGLKCSVSAKTVTNCDERMLLVSRRSVFQVAERAKIPSRPTVSVLPTTHCDERSESRRGLRKWVINRVFESLSYFLSHTHTHNTHFPLSLTGPSTPPVFKPRIVTSIISFASALCPLLL